MIISMYDYTGLMVEPFRQAGHTCLIIDGKHPEGLHADPERPGLYKLGTWLNRDTNTRYAIILASHSIGERVTAVFGFPPCDDLAVSGARWFADKLEGNPHCQYDAADRARLVEDIGKYYLVPWFAENPVSVLATLWRKPDFTFNPYDYGGYLPEDDVHPEFPDHIAPRDAYPKKTCIWCGGGFQKPPVKPVTVAPGYSAQYGKLGGRSERTKTIRSATPRGWAQAVFTMLTGGE